MLSPGVVKVTGVVTGAMTPACVVYAPVYVVEVDVDPAGVPVLVFMEEAVAELLLVEVLVLVTELLGLVLIDPAVAVLPRVLYDSTVEEEAGVDFIS